MYKVQFRKGNVLVYKNSILSIYFLTQNGNDVWQCLLKKKKEMKYFSKCNALKFNILKFCDNLLPIYFYNCNESYQVHLYT